MSTWHTKMLNVYAILSFWDILLQDAYIIFFLSVDSFGKKHVQFCFDVQFPILWVGFAP